MSGFPRAVRAVASVMRNNRFPLAVPCHRVVKKNGAVGGFGGQIKGSKVNLKRRLIESEKLTV
jgi:methylated-DNA-[protein]-cysteine S-methyltransferase